MRLWSALLLAAVLAACSGTAPTTDGPVPEPVAPPGPPAQGRTLTTWTVDPAFDVNAVQDAQARAWYRQMGLEIAKEQATECLPPGTPPEAYEYATSSGTVAACSATKHWTGRALNHYVTSLLTVFRVTGDRTLLEEVDRVMEIARGGLRDTDGDGFRNWAYLARYDQNDFNHKEDSLAHGFLAEVAYVFKQNAAYSTPEHDYAAHSAAWSSYLRGDFEAKWAGRGETAEGLPVDRLMHPFMEILRYGVYMEKLFPSEARYRRFNARLAEVALSEFRTDATPGGEAFVWSHVVRRWDPQINGDPNRCIDFQMGTYPQQTMQAFMDLALEGYPGFSDTEKMHKLSRSLSESILDATQYGFLYKDVGGLRNGLLNPNERKNSVVDGYCFHDAYYGNNASNFRSEGSYRALSWGFMAAFAPESSTSFAAGEIYRVNEQVYGNPLSGSIRAQRVHVPAAMVFTHLYNGGNGSFSLMR